MGKPPEEKIAEFVELVEAMKGTVRQLHAAIQELKAGGISQAELKEASLRCGFPGLDLDKFMNAGNETERLEILLASVAAQQNRGN